MHDSSQLAFDLTDSMTIYSSISLVVKDTLDALPLLGRAIQHDYDMSTRRLTWLLSSCPTVLEVHPTDVTQLVHP